MFNTLNRVQSSFIHFVLKSDVIKVKICKKKWKIIWNMLLLHLKCLRFDTFKENFKLIKCVSFFYLIKCSAKFQVHITSIRIMLRFFAFNFFTILNYLLWNVLSFLNGRYWFHENLRPCFPIMHVSWLQGRAKGRHAAAFGNCNQFQEMLC